jgi:hypothetical protein
MTVMLSNANKHINFKGLILIELLVSLGVQLSDLATNIRIKGESIAKEVKKRSLRYVFKVYGSG